MRRKIFWWTLTLIWCIVIFFQSAKPATLSSADSDSITQLINNIIAFFFGKGNFILDDFIVRKVAHFLEYAILGLLLFNSIKKPDELPKSMVISIALAVLYAISDEFHQYFVPGRAAKILDVGIDSLGILAGTTASFIKARKR